MNRFLKVLSFVMIVCCLAGCKQQNAPQDTTQKPATSVELYMPAAIEVPRRIISEKGVDSYITIREYSEKLVATEAEKNFFMKYFPAGKDMISKYTAQAPALENFSLDFMYVSDGRPFHIHPVYSLGWYDLTLGLFYYDELGQKVDIDFWNMQDDDWGKQSYAYYAENKINDTKQYEIFKTLASGYEIQMPKGVPFGFYISGNDDAKAGRYYCAAMENPNGRVQAASFARNDRSYIGFEDQQHGDNDLNDLICFIDPKLAIYQGPTTELVDSAMHTIDIPGEVEVDIHQQEHNDWGEIKTSVHLRHCFDSIVVNIPVRPDLVVEQDDFAVRVYDKYYTLLDTEYQATVEVRHNDEGITIVISGVEQDAIYQMLRQYHDGLTVEVHSYTRRAEYKCYYMEDVWGAVQDSKVTVYPEMENCELKVHRTTALFEEEL